MGAGHVGLGLKRGGAYQGVKFLAVSMVRSGNAMDGGGGGWRRSERIGSPSGGEPAGDGMLGCSRVVPMGMVAWFLFAKI